MFEWSFKQSVVFWWLLFLVIQQVERVFLLPDVMAIEVPSTVVFVKTFTTGFRADLIVASIAVLLIYVLAGMVGTLWWASLRWQRGPTLGVTGYRWALVIAGTVMGVVQVVLLLIDIGY